MKRQVLLYCPGVVACILCGCAHYPEAREQRPVYSYENVEMGPADSGREYRNDGTVSRDGDQRQ